MYIVQHVPVYNYLVATCTSFVSLPDQAHAPKRSGGPIHDIVDLGLTLALDAGLPTPDPGIQDIALIAVNGIRHDLQDEDILDMGEIIFPSS